MKLQKSNFHVESDGGGPSGREFYLVRSFPTKKKADFYRSRESRDLFPTLL